jgi:hypothetical protein
VKDKGERKDKIEVKGRGGESKIKKREDGKRR